MFRPFEQASLPRRELLQCPLQPKDLFKLGILIFSQINKGISNHASDDCFSLCGSVLSLRNIWDSEVPTGFPVLPLHQLSILLKSGPDHTPNLQNSLTSIYSTS